MPLTVLDLILEMFGDDSLCYADDTICLVDSAPVSMIDHKDLCQGHKAAVQLVGSHKDV